MCFIQDGRNNEHLVCDFDNTMMANQRRMNADPFETILIDMGYRVRGNPTSGAGQPFNHDDSSPEEGSVQCRCLFDDFFMAIVSKS